MNCAITGNSAGDGGGVFCYRSSPSITNCAITGNSAGGGGGVYCSYGSPSIANCAITRNSASYYGGVSCFNCAPSITNCTIISNSGGGIYCWNASAIITNCTVRLNGGTPINVYSGSPTVSYCNINAAWSGLGGNNIDSDSRFVVSPYWGTVTAAGYDEVSFTSVLRHHGDPLPEGALNGREIQVGTYYYVILSNTADTITVWGDMTRGGAVRPPQAWRVEDYHIQPSSPNRGAGIGPGADSSVPIADMDGDVRSGATCDIGADEYNVATAPGGAWGRLWVTNVASSANFAFCVVEKGAGLLAEIPNVSVTQCLLQGNTEFGARFTAGTATISDTTATLNLGPGIDAASWRPLTRCTATWNGGAGLSGMALTSCTAYGNGYSNGGNGISGASATDSTSEFCAGAGLTLTAGAQNCAARDNRGIGIKTTGGNLTNCAASFNTGRGLEISGGGTASSCTVSYNGGGILTDGSTISDCVVEGNLGVGVTGSGASTISNIRITANTGSAISGVTIVQNCAIASNTLGVSGASMLSGAYVGANTGDGVTGGAISNSTIVGNTGCGVNGLASLTNSWVVGNGSYGIFSLSSFGTISNSWIAENGSDGIYSSGGSGAVSYSAILNNSGIGTRNILSLTNSNIYGNKGVWQAFDNVTAGSGDRNFENNWWGTSNTALLAASAEFNNMPFLQDTLDGSGNWLLDVWPYRTSPAPNALDATLAPAFLLFVMPNQDDPVNVGQTTFTLVFSKAMDPAIRPAVTFGAALPYTAHVVLPDAGGANGWITSTTWQAFFSVGSDTGDGINTLRVSGATAADGFLIPDDCTHTFIVDTSGGNSANNGLAVALGSDSMRCTWEETGKPADALGYNIRRGLSLDLGSFQRVNSSPQPLPEFNDAGLSQNTLYFYLVDIVDAQNNATQWTEIFFAMTNPGPTPSPTPTLHPSPTPSPTPHSTSTATPHSSPTASPVLTPTPNPTPVTLPVLIDYLLQRRSLTPEQMRQADINNDGVIDMGDVVALAARSTETLMLKQPPPVLRKR
ncbi:MAG: right-handed parallel beta-helix repeat-containing protein [Candidatus Sumerlaeota bacterium]|nr:right-handed parallel beta-helix repeat-containing protein [Candidatus Sumerlaeota bacterium]